MSEPTPIRRKRVDGRSKRVKLAAVMAAEMSGQTVAAKETGIPRETIRDWLKNPKYAEIRRKTREELADEVKAVAHLAWARIAATMDVMEPRDAIFAAEKASTLLQLLSGDATSRMEHRELGDELDDHERKALRDAIDKELESRVEA